MDSIRRTGLVVANPAAGTSGRDLIDGVAARCRPHLADLDVHVTTGPRDAAVAAAAAVGRYDVVIAVGGDGTVRECVEGLLSAGSGTGLPALLVVPAGTGNSGYRALWGRLPWPDAITAAFTGVGARERLIDLARLVELDELVLLGASTGLVADALEVAATVLAGPRERYRIALAEAAAVHVPYPGRVIVDGQVVHTGKIVLTNVGGGRYRGGAFQLLPHSVLDDGLLDVCVIGDDVDPLDIATVTRDGAHVNRQGVTYARGERITVERTDGAPLSFEHDGDLRSGLTGTITAQVLPRVLPVLCSDSELG